MYSFCFSESLVQFGVGHTHVSYPNMLVDVSAVDRTALERAIGALSEI